MGPARQNVSSLAARKVDTNTSAIRSVLSTLAEIELPISQSSDDIDSGSVELLVKISPPVHVRIVPPTNLVVSAAAATTTTTTIRNNKFDDFMSAWTSLVGDPVLSKWIVVVLAISISLNGYLLKGIAAGMASGKGLGTKGGVRFLCSDGTEQQQEPEQVAAPTPVTVQSTVQRAASPVQAPLEVIIPIEAAGSKTNTSTGTTTPAAVVPTFTLDDVDRRLKARRLIIQRQSSFSGGPNTPPTTSPSESSSDNESPSFAANRTSSIVRTLEECTDIYENGPRPLSFTLSLMNDEELILLCQNGKIAAYALEKVLGSSELERAVRIRRALICEFHFLNLPPPFFFL